ncbi:MAG: hypothetical protein GY820_42700 [Gammaproteobacteria bacterium]|nr:hypothetical protein [Gammaproteobacteria bacterium]
MSHAELTTLRIVRAEFCKDKNKVEHEVAFPLSQENFQFGQSVAEEKGPETPARTIRSGVNSACDNWRSDVFACSFGPSFLERARSARCRGRAWPSED